MDRKRARAKARTRRVTNHVPYRTRPIRSFLWYLLVSVALTLHLLIISESTSLVSKETSLKYSDILLGIVRVLLEGVTN